MQDCLDSLTLADMVELLEGPIHLTECRTERASCKRMGKCDLRHRIELVQQSLTDVFSRIKVTDLFLSAVGKGTQRHRCCATLE